MTRMVVAMALAAGLGCKDQGADKGAEQLNKGAAFLEAMFDRMQTAATSGQFCYPLIDGYVRHNVQTLGVQVAKDVRKFEDYLDFATIPLDVYKTPAGDRYDALAKKYQTWKTGPYASAVEACQVCARNGAPEGDPVRPDLSSCHVP